MNKNQRQLLLKGFMRSCFWCIVTIVIGIVIINRFNYSLKDVLFIEGIVLIITGLLSSIGEILMDFIFRRLEA